jgi:hypothetical protein
MNVVEEIPGYQQHWKKSFGKRLPSTTGIPLPR